MNWEYASRVLPRDGEARSGDAVFARVDASSARISLTAGQGLVLHSYRHDDASVLVIGAKARLAMQP